MATEGAQFDGQQYDAKTSELIEAEVQDFFRFYDECRESFEQMGLQENLLRGIFAYGLEKPSAIQKQGRGLDVNQQAQSGTGKTATFNSEILQKLDNSLAERQAVILAPTLELAHQIEKVMGDDLGFKVHVCVGGTIDLEYIDLYRHPI